MLLALTRYDVPDAEAAAFLQQARPALAVLLERPGCRDAQLARAVDETEVWVMASRWESVGAYRRALSHPEVKLHAVPLMYRCRDEPTSFEVLLDGEPGRLDAHASDVAGA
ncbi:MAG: antibiotic biosynthesis monooxygenase family protein [Kineosporiaceae bacterium]